MKYMFGTYTASPYHAATTHIVAYSWPSEAMHRDILQLPRPFFDPPIEHILAGAHIWMCACTHAHTLHDLYVQ